MWKSRDVLFFALQTLTSLLYFFLTREIKLVIIYCHDVMMTMITYLLAVQGALLPACVCMKGVLTVMTEWRRMWWRWWQWYRECLCYCYYVECFVFFSCPWEIHEKCLCVFAYVCVSVCLLRNTYLLQSGKWIDVNLTAWIREKECVDVYTFACLTVWILW